MNLFKKKQTTERLFNSTDEVKEWRTLSPSKIINVDTRSFTKQQRELFDQFEFERIKGSKDVFVVVSNDYASNFCLAIRFDLITCSLETFKDVLEKTIIPVFDARDESDPADFGAGYTFDTVDSIKANWFESHPEYFPMELESEGCAGLDKKGLDKEFILKTLNSN